MTEQEENNLINNMCLTWRHDFGLLPDNEKQFLFDEMKSVFDHNIKPLLISKVKSDVVQPKAFVPDYTD